MVYKLGNISDLNMLPCLDARTWANLYELASVLSSEYGTNRDVDRDDGGYVLYATPGTDSEEVKKIFDYSAHPIEYVNRDFYAVPPICTAFFIQSNEFAVAIVMSIADAPAEVVEAFEEGF